MKMTARLTLDGLVRALRWKAHALAERVEDGYEFAEDGAGAGAKSRSGGAKEADDDRARR